MIDGQKELGKIVSVDVSHESDERPSVWVIVKFKGSGQGFGGLYLNTEKLLESFVNSLMQPFNADYVEDLVGKKCYALRGQMYSHSSTPIKVLIHVLGKQ